MALADLFRPWAANRQMRERLAFLQTIVDAKHAGLQAYVEVNERLITEVNALRRENAAIHRNNEALIRELATFHPEVDHKMEDAPDVST